MDATVLNGPDTVCDLDEAFQLLLIGRQPVVSIPKVRKRDPKLFLGLPDTRHNRLKFDLLSTPRMACSFEQYRSIANTVENGTAQCICGQVVKHVKSYILVWITVISRGTCGHSSLRRL
jgi:hypothetical protein